MANGIPPYLLPNEAHEAQQPEYLKAIYNLQKYMPKPKPAGGAANAAPPAAQAQAPAPADVMAAATPGMPEPPQKEEDPYQKFLNQMMAGPSDEEKQAKQQALEGYLQGIKEQKSGLKDSQDLLDMYKKMPIKQADTQLKPLLALIDSYTGTKLANTVEEKPGETVEQRQYKIAQLSDLLSKRRGDLTKAQADVLKQSGGGGGKGTSMRDLTRMEAMKKTQGRAEERYVVDAEKNISKNVTSMDKEWETFHSDLATAEAGLASGDITQLKPIMAILARKVSGEKGVLTDKDVQRTILPTMGMTVSTFQQWLEVETNAVSPKAVAGMQELVAASKQAMHKKLGNLLDTQESDWSSRKARGYQGTMEPGGFGRNRIDHLRNKLDKYYSGAPAAAPAAAPGAAPAAAPTGLDMSDPRVKSALENGYTPEQIQEFLVR